MNLQQSLFAHRLDDAAALEFQDGSSLSTGMLLKEIGRIATALVSRGVRVGDRVSFMVDKSPFVVALAQACFRIGAVIHPLNTSYTAVEVERLLADAKPRLVVCSARFAEFCIRLGAGSVATLEPNGGGSLLSGIVETALPPAAPCAPDTLAAILYTSGTTGVPKGACITQGNLLSSACALAGVWRLGTSDTLLHALPLYHAHGLLTSINTMLAAGGSTLLLPHFDVGDVMRALPRSTVMMAVPTHYGRMLQNPNFGHEQVAGCQLFISGSAPLPGELSNRFHDRTGCRIIERYGSTETAIVTALSRGEERRSGWVGFPVPGTDVRLSGEGELQTRGKNVFAGYWEQPGMTSEAFTADGWFMTGDLAEIDREGCVRLLGRSKDLIITGGLNVSPKEVEDAVLLVQGVNDATVFGVFHPDFGEAVVAAVEIDGTAFDERASIEFLKRRLAAYKVPKRVIPIASIPRNPMGKVLKTELRTFYDTLFADPRNGVTTTKGN